LAKRARSIFEDNVVFSPEAKAELQKLGELTMSKQRGCRCKLWKTDDQDLARDAWEQCKKVKLYQKEMRKLHIVRLSNGTCSPQAGFVLMELIINMKRISDHSKNVSQLVLGIF
jgi:phosphate:Na+ symporter